MNKHTEKPPTYAQKWRLYNMLCNLARICEKEGAVEQVIIHGTPDKRSQVGCTDPVLSIEDVMKKANVKDITEG